MLRSYASTIEQQFWEFVSDRKRGLVLQLKTTKIILSWNRSLKNHSCIREICERFAEGSRGCRRFAKGWWKAKLPGSHPEQNGLVCRAMLPWQNPFKVVFNLGFGLPAFKYDSQIVLGACSAAWFSRTTILQASILNAGRVAMATPWCCCNLKENVDPHKQS